MNNNHDIFLNKIYRNAYIRTTIFQQIKQINKGLKYIRYNFYDVPLSLIINIKNEQMLIEKLKLHQLQRKEQYENSKVNYEDYYNHYLDFNLQDYNKLLKWKNLNLSTFKIYFNHFQIEIKQQSKLIDSYQMLVLDNGVSVDILKFLLSNYSQDEVIILLSIEKDQSLLKISTYSIDMFNYLFKRQGGNQNLFKEIYQTADTILSTLSVSFKIKETSQLVLKEIINSFSVDFINQLVNNNNWEYFINVLIESNNLEIFQVLLNKLTTIDDIKSNDYVELYGFKISIKLLSNLKINLKSFISDNTMFTLFKIMVEKVMVGQQLFSKSITQDITIEINGPDYSDYIIEKLKENNISLAESNFKFTYKCQRDLNQCTSEQLVTNFSLLDTNRLYYDSFKSPLLNNDLNYFEIFFSRFGFKKRSFLEALELGYENMVVYILNKTDHQYILGLQHDDIKLNFYFGVFLKSLPSDTSDGYQLLYKTLLPIINDILSSDKILPSPSENIYITMNRWKPIPMFFKLINNQTLPLNPIKRKLFIERISKISNYSKMKSDYFKAQFSAPVGDKNNLKQICLPDFVDIDKHLYIINFQGSAYEKNNFFSRIFIDCLRMGSFKLIKKISKFNPIIQPWYSINTSLSFKLLFYTILKLGYIKLDTMETLFSTISQSNPAPLPYITNFQLNLVYDYCVTPGVNQTFLNLVLGYNEFKNFNFYYALAKGKTSSKHLDLVAADKYLIISQILLASSLSKKDVDKLLNWSTCNPIVSCTFSKHCPENSTFIQQILDFKCEDNFISLVKQNFNIDFEKSLFHKYKPIFKLFGLINK